MRSDSTSRGPRPFESFFGRRVNYDFIMQDAHIKLPREEEEKLGENTVLCTVKGGRQITVGKYLRSGGQGQIYLTEDPGLVIKLYKTESRTRHVKEKIKKMIEFENGNPSICWPIDALTTQNGVFVGFIMPRVEGNTMARMTTAPTRVMRDNPNYSRLTQVNILLDTLNNFKFLHSMNVIAGDVKLQNVMLTKDDSGNFKVTIIDIDSVQVEQFPCESTTPGYDAPEVILSRGKNKHAEKLPDGNFKFIKYYRDVYRTLEIESYSISVLIYKFLMNGMPPYDYRDYDKISNDEVTYNDNELCIEKKFAYGLTAEETEPTCSERAIWAHFPSFLKEAFVNVFKGNKRYTDDEWINIFQKYKQLLVSGELTKADSECMNPFPVTEINYSDVKIDLVERAEGKGFMMMQAVSRIIKSLGKDQLKKRLFEISDALKSKTEYIIDNYRFRLVYNIGVFKKVICEYVL